uniref:PRLI-interacting factor A n=1 Tax=Manihot esculenta TaxID=3983 RepID=A0A2C9UEL2_MANES
MNDQSQMLNPLQLMSQAHMMSQSQMMNSVQPQVLNQNSAILAQSQAMSQPPQKLNPVQSQSQTRMMSHSGAMTQPQPAMMMMNQRNYKPWSPQQQSSMDLKRKFQNQQNPLKFNNNISNNFVPSKPRSKKNWKGKTMNKDQRRMEKPMPNIPTTSNSAPALAGPCGFGGYKPPSLNDLQTQNRIKARKYYHPKKKFNNRFAPYAPRNTTSFIIRAKKAGGIASLVSPCPMTPAVLPTPMFSPSREVLGDMAKEEWGVDGYGSMKGLIRLRSPGNEVEVHDEEEEDEGNGSSESDVEEHVEVERRLDHDLSRFEMIYPTYGGGDYSYNNVLENRVDDQDTHIAQLEEENLTLKERLFLMERELGDLRRRLQFLERHQGQGRSLLAVEDVNEEVVENVSENGENENESDGGSDIGATGNENNEEVMEDVSGKGKIGVNDGKESYDVCMQETVSYNGEIGKDVIENKIVGSTFVVRNEVIEKVNEAKGEEVRNEVIIERFTCIFAAVCRCSLVFF